MKRNRTAQEIYKDIRNRRIALEREAKELRKWENALKVKNTPRKKKEKV